MPISDVSAHSRTRPWTMLLALTTAFAMSQAFRTVAALLALPLQVDFKLTPQQLGSFAGSFHFAFGLMQPIVGIGIDLHGVRRTVLAGFPLAVAGAVLSAVAPSFGVLLVGQVLIGIGCAPAFLACTVFIARHFAADRFAATSGAVMALGGVGLLVTGTPLAWLIEATSWRMGFWVLAGGSAVAWGLIAGVVHEARPPAAVPELRPPAMVFEPRPRSAVHDPQAPVATPHPAPESLGRALLTFVSLLRLPWTAGIVALAFVCYAAFISLRGLWLGPMLIERYGYTLVQSGNVALAVSAVSLVSPALFGRFDPGDGRRRGWLIGWTLLSAVGFAALAWVHEAGVDVAITIGIGMVSGYMILQYSEVRAAYPPHLVGRALALFTMAMFLGVAVMQSFTGWVASLAQARGVEVYTAVLSTIAVLLGLGALAFAALPRPTATLN